MITRELFDACEFAKTAADMSIPVEPMPTPEPGSEAIEGMVNGSMMDPNSVGAGTYAGAVDQAALAQAKARAAAAAQAAAAQKTAAVEEAFEMGYFDAMYEYDEMNKIASVEDAYEMGYAAAIEELEKIAASRGVESTFERYQDAKKLRDWSKNRSAVDKGITRATAAMNNAKGDLAVKAALLRGSVKANPKAIAGGAGAIGALAAAGVLGKRAIDARRKAKLMRRAGIGGAALAGLAGLGYAANKARD